jgi:CRISPR-associated protein Cas5
MGNIDLSILQKKPELNSKAKLLIEPLAPLSMVNDLPGSFYKSLKSPSKKMLCGLFENLMGWHIDIADRTAIQKELIKLRKKQKVNFLKPQQGSSYIPLLMEYFDIELVVVPPTVHYNDLWSRAYRRSDTIKHLGGTRFMDGFYIKTWDKLKEDVANDEEMESKEKVKKYDLLFKENIGKFATFYSSPTAREYVNCEEAIEIVVSIDQELLNQIHNNLTINNCLYVGNSEGWINLKLIENE